MAKTDTADLNAVSDHPAERTVTLTVWLCRLVAGCTFMVAGWSKAVDPWGFLYMLQEYMNVWSLEMPREILLSADVILSCTEFLLGVLVLTGCMRRVAVWMMAAIMAVMLPLTVYIAVANPVSDCGCFGDFIKISNGATLLKNVVLSAAIVWLIIKNTSVKGLFPVSLQWLVTAASLGLPMYLAFYGYQIQPLVDFRPYKTGTSLIDVSDDSGSEPVYLYEKGGQTREFTLSELPDSSWTYVSMKSEEESLPSVFSVFDPDTDEDVTADVIGSAPRQLLLVVTSPDEQFLGRAHYVNDLYRYLQQFDVEMTGLIGASGEGFRRWYELTNPRFEAYSVEDTSLKELVRGDAALVYLENGTIKWKRTLYSLDATLPYSDPAEGNRIESLEPVDSFSDAAVPMSIWAGTILLLYFIGLSSRLIGKKSLNLHPINKNNKNQPTNQS